MYYDGLSAVCADPGIDKRDPRWVGAWWLGFVVCSVVISVTSLPMLLVPPKLAGHDSCTTADNKNILSNSKGFSIGLSFFSKDIGFVIVTYKQYDTFILTFV